MITNVEQVQTQNIMQHLTAVPYDVTRHTLYCAADLYQGYDPNQPETFHTCHDSRVYQHFLSTGKQLPDVAESLARTLHDHGIHAALTDFLLQHNPLRCVGIMGGHALLRTDPMYRAIVLISKRLTEQGFLMLSGGGPGAMEATHLGAWLAGRSQADTDDALQMLQPYPSFHDDGWLSSAFRVMQKYPLARLQSTNYKFESLGIPTWLYGHEPSTPFATHIAKFFENSIREDSILTLAFGGLIYAPGSAGTMQEIFQEAVQNHYLSFGFSSPMIFLGRQYWTEEMPAYTFLTHLVETGKYKNLLLTLSDDTEDIINTLLEFQTKMKNINN
ncbi:MAG: hypothetical protein Q4E32_02985 [Bacteroidales bacterium]|nr:hypothetical protein [Bacteroidales bacterium]